MATAFIGVGSNLGSRGAYLEEALALIKETPGVLFNKLSGIYETEPEGGIPQGKFLNCVWKLSTQLSPEELLGVLGKIEDTLGRKREVPDGPRTIDCDLLFYDDLVYRSQSLTIPHPRAHTRYFVLKPFCDIDPDFIHPVLRRSMRELLNDVVGAWKKDEDIPFTTTLNKAD